MRVRSERKFSVGDAMILIAATAFVLAVLRHPTLWPSLEDWPPGTVTNGCFLMNRLLYALAYPAAAWSVALLVIRLRRPRPDLRRLAREPGMVACTVAGVFLVIALVSYLSTATALAIDWNRSFGHVLSYKAENFCEGYNEEQLLLLPSAIGGGVTAAWTIQAVGGRWRPQPNWIDRAGRTLGVFWVANLPSGWFTYTT